MGVDFCVGGVCEAGCEAEGLYFDVGVGAVELDFYFADWLFN